MGEPGQGYTYKEIADQLFLSVKTVQNHVQNILTKLQLSKRYELMRYASAAASTGPEPRGLVASPGPRRREARRTT